VHADVARSLASARASLDKNDLTPAQRALMSVLAAQPGNFEAQQMQTELASREGERDSLLGYARLCARDGQWVCAWRNAGHALTVDASSQEAKELLSRAIAEHGATASRSFDPSLPGADDH
jgi:predicted Zn-dependent protease